MTLRLKFSHVGIKLCKALLILRGVAISRHLLCQVLTDLRGELIAQRVHSFIGSRARSRLAIPVGWINWLVPLLPGIVA